MTSPTPTVEYKPDRVRITAYYSENGRLENVEVALNCPVNMSDIDSIVQWLAKAGRPSPANIFPGDTARTMTFNGKFG